MPNKKKKKCFHLCFLAPYAETDPDFSSDNRFFRNCSEENVVDTLLLFPLFLQCGFEQPFLYMKAVKPYTGLLKPLL